MSKSTNIGNMPLTLSTLASDPTTLADFYAEADQSNSPACGPATSSYAGQAAGWAWESRPPVRHRWLKPNSHHRQQCTNNSAASLAVSANAVNDARTATTTTFSGSWLLPTRERDDHGHGCGGIRHPDRDREAECLRQGTLSLPLTNGVASHTYSSLAAEAIRSRPSTRGRAWPGLLRTSPLAPQKPPLPSPWPRQLSPSVSRVPTCCTRGRTP